MNIYFDKFYSGVFKINLFNNFPFIQIKGPWANENLNKKLANQTYETFDKILGYKTLYLKILAHSS